jgi:AraC-like DNA-binding protein
MDKIELNGFFRRNLDEKKPLIYNNSGDIMFNNMEEIKLISVIRGIASVRRSYPARPSHALILRLDGSSAYDFGTKVLELHPGGMLFIPKGAQYTVRRLEDKDTEYIVFNFDCLWPDAVPRLFSTGGFGRLEEVWRLEKSWLFGGAAGRIHCTGMLYELLAHAAALESADYADRQKLGQLAPALEYLQEHMFDVDLRVETLHTLCGMSDTYFRRLFRASFGAGPREYIISRRLTRARDLLTGSDCGTVAQAAAAVGYSDPLYFSRIFTKHYGFPPSACAGMEGEVRHV